MSSLFDDLVMKRINTSNYQCHTDGIFTNIDNRVKFITRYYDTSLYQIDSWVCDVDKHSRVNYKDISEPLSSQSIEILKNIGYSSCDLFDDHLIFNLDSSTSDSISISNLSNEIFENFSSFVEGIKNPTIEDYVYDIEDEELYIWFNFANDKYSYLMKDEVVNEKGFVRSYLKYRLLSENFVNSGFPIWRRRDKKNNDKVEIFITEDLEIQKITTLSDASYKVRAKIAKHCKDEDLDILVNDENPEVRYEVAKRGRDKDLNVLVNDEDPYVRAAVAEHGRDKDLDILVHDKDRHVRAEVAESGRARHLDILINDESWYIRDIVFDNKNFRYDDERFAYPEGRVEMIEEGCYGKEMDYIRKDPYMTDEIKLALIENGIDVEKFLTDGSVKVREAAARKIAE